jgi:Na+/melibiose symporter-like transporter
MFQWYCFMYPFLVLYVSLVLICLFMFLIIVLFNIIICVSIIVYYVSLVLKNGSNYYVSSNTILLEELTCMSIAILTLTRKVNAHEYYLLGYEKCKRTFTLDVYLKFIHFWYYMCHWC